MFLLLSLLGWYVLAFVCTIEGAIKLTFELVVDIVLLLDGIVISVCNDEQEQSLLL